MSREVKIDGDTAFVSMEPFLHIQKMLDDAGIPKYGKERIER